MFDMTGLSFHEQHAVGDRSIQHVNMFFLKHFYNAALHIKVRADIGINSVKLHMYRNPNNLIHKKRDK